MGPFRHILVPVDFSEPSRHALDKALELAITFEAAVTITHTFEYPGYAYAGMAYAPIDLVTPIEDAARKLLSDTLEQAKKRVPGARAVLRSGAPAEETLEVAKEVGADLVVMGTHGRRGIAHALLGSVAERVVRLSPIPVLTIRSPAPAGG